MADFTLYVLETCDVRNGRTTGRFVARDVTTDALEVELLVLARERRVRVVMRGLVPKRTLRLVTGGALLDADVPALPLGDRRRQHVLERDAVVLVHAPVVRAETRL